MDRTQDIDLCKELGTIILLANKLEKKECTEQRPANTLTCYEFLRKYTPHDLSASLEIYESRQRSKYDRVT